MPASEGPRLFVENGVYGRGPRRGVYKSKRMKDFSERRYEYDLAVVWPSYSA
jgi:hypothetical protein